MKACLLAILFALPCLLIVDFTSANRHYPTARIGNCGPDYDNQTCPFHGCCSNWGGCGNSSDFCAPDVCLPEYGECWNSSPPPPPPSPPPPPPSPPPPGVYCGPDHGNQSCIGYMCCSNQGKCGDSFDYCRIGNCQEKYGWCPPPPPPRQPLPGEYCGPDHGDQSCIGLMCCSNQGKCGDSYDYCRKDNCQLHYGSCYIQFPTTPASESADNVAAEMFAGDSDHSLIGKVVDGLGFINPF